MDDSPFGKLPPELMNALYTLVMFEGQVISVWNKFLAPATDSRPSIARARGHNQNLARSLVLASTCRQIREESTPLFYGINDFSFHNFEILKAFVEMIGDQNTRALQNIIIERVARPRVVLRGVTGNNIARQRLKTLQIMPEEFTWKSVKISVRFDGLQTPAGVPISFDLVDLTKPWTTISWEGICLIVEERFSEPTVTSGLANLNREAMKELGIWKDILTKLQQPETTHESEDRALEISGEVYHEASTNITD